MADKRAPKRAVTMWDCASLRTQLREYLTEPTFADVTEEYGDHHLKVEMPDGTVFDVFVAQRITPIRRPRRARG